MKTTVILAHPNYESSIANKTIVNNVASKVDNVEVRNIYELYPDFKIDVEAEQKALLNADVIVFQYPFYWYNIPAILKQWFDDVFNFNFAYSPEGDKLKGKSFVLSFTVGGPQESYTAEGYNNFQIKDFLNSLHQTANLAQMKFEEPVFSHGMIYIPGVYNTAEVVEERATVQAIKLIELLNSLKN